MGHRPLRVGEQIQRALSELLQRGALKDPGVGFITITGVTMPPDLKQAKVFFSVYGTAAEKKATQAALDRARHFLRREVGQSLRLKSTPDLLFVLDETGERAARIDQLLKEARPAEAVAPTDDDTASDDATSGAASSDEEPG